MARRTKSLTRSGGTGRSLDRFTIVCLCAIALVCVSTIVVLFKLSGLRRAPSWWTDAVIVHVDASESAIKLENRVTSALTRVREEPDWNVAIEQENLNAWLAHRLEPTIRTHFGDEAWDGSLREVRIRLRDDEITCGARIPDRHGSSVVWVRMALLIDKDQRFVARPVEAAIGRTRIPVSWVEGYLGEENLGEARLDLGDGREVLIRAIRARDGRLEFALRTQLVESF